MHAVRHWTLRFDTHRSRRGVLENKDYNRTLFELSPIGLALFTMDGTVTDCNEAYASITGRTREETIGLTYWELTPKEYNDAAKEIMATLTKTGSFQHYEKHYYHRDGHLVPVRLSGNLIEQEGDLHIWCSVEDITERKIAEEALRTANQKLTALNELRSQFFADISHELRTPLTVIRGEAEVTLRGKDKPIGEYKAVLAQIVDLTNQINRLVSDLLFLAQSEAGTIQINREPSPLDEILVSACQEGGVLIAQKGLTLNFASPTEQWRVMGDAYRLKQLLLILLHNAASYTPVGGQVQVGVKTVRSRVSISITDTGVGIPPDNLAHVFERFYRGRQGSKRHPGGMGLGLPIAKWITEAHHGHIHLSSEVGRGTTVTVTLPLLS